jgi:putative transposase
MIRETRQSLKNARRRYYLSEENSLSHTRWSFTFHTAFAPKYRRKAICGRLRRDIGQILRQLGNYKKVEIVETNSRSDHIHMCLRIYLK